MEPLKNKLIQARLSENELADFESVKREFGIAGTSKAVRQMIEDEKLLMQAEENWQKGKRGSRAGSLAGALHQRGQRPVSAASEHPLAACHENGVGRLHPPPAGQPPLGAAGACRHGDPDRHRL